MDETLLYASFEGDLHAVSCLLADGRANPAAWDSAALRFAVFRKFTGVVQALLVDGRADPAAWDGFALDFAARCGQLEIVASLLACGRACQAAAMARALAVAESNDVRGCILGWQRWLRRRNWLRACACRSTRK
jgi:hypothetical protein